MVKKKNIQNIYETDQANKKHRKKNKKLEKREKIRKDKKKTKKIKYEKRKLHKYILLSFKENQQELDLARLPMDLEEVVKNVDKLLKLNESSVKEVPELFKMMEENKKEINLSGLEDLSAQKYICKLFKNFKFSQNPKNPFKFKIKETTIDPKARSTTEVEYIIRQCISSFYLFIKSIFEYQNYVLKNSQENKEKNLLEDESKSDMRNENDSSSQETDPQNSSGTEKEKVRDNDLDNEKYEIDYENQLIEEKFGGNSELVNKAFHKILNDDQLFKDKRIPNSILEEKSRENTKEEIKQNSEAEKPKKVIGPTIPDFLASTMKLLNNNEENEDIYNFDKKPEIKPQSSLDDLLNNITYTKDRNDINKKNKNKIVINSSKIEPINKDSYNRILEEERRASKDLFKEMDDYETKYRGTSLLEMHQEKMKEKGKNKTSLGNFHTFDKEKFMNAGRVDSKRALGIMQDKNGLKGRFEQKEKYIGY